jgi:hypothetical protein
MKKLTIALISLIFLFSLANISSAQLLNGSSKSAMSDNANLVSTTGGLGQLSIGAIVATIIQTCLGLLALIFLVLMVFAGFQWMTAGGNETKVSKAQETIKTAVIGLVIVLAAYAITYFIFKYLPFTASTTGSSSPQVGTSGSN